MRREQRRARLSHSSVKRPLEASSNPSHLLHLHSENFAPPSFFSFLSVLPLQMNVLLLFSFMYSAFSQSTLGNMCFFVSLVSIFFLFSPFFFYRFKLVNTHFFWFQLLFCIIFTDVLTLIFHVSSTLIFRTVFLFFSLVFLSFTFNYRLFYFLYVNAAVRSE